MRNPIARDLATIAILLLMCCVLNRSLDARLGQLFHELEV